MPLPLKFGHAIVILSGSLNRWRSNPLRTNMALLGSLSLVVPLWACEGAEEPRCAPAAWTSTETTAEHRELRAVRARELQAAAAKSQTDPSGWSARANAIRASAIALEPLVGELIPPGAAPWYVELAGINFGLRTKSGLSAGACLERLLSMLDSPEVARDPMAIAHVRNAIGCAIVLDVQQSMQTDGPSCDRLKEGAAWFASVCQIPEAALNEAGVQLELARLLPNERAKSLAAARSALARLDSDALSCTYAANSLFGLDIQGNKVVYVIDASQAVSDSGFAAAKDAVVASLRGLPQETRFAVILAAENLRAFPASGSGDGGWLLRGADRAERPVADASSWLRSQARGNGSLSVESLAPIAGRSPSEVLFVLGGDLEDPRGEASAVGKAIAASGSRVSVLLSKPGSPSDQAALELLADGAAGRLARGAGGRMRLLAGAEPLGVDPQTLRTVAASAGRWTPAIARQESAIRALLSLLDGKDPSAASVSAVAALQPLVPDPLTAEPGPPAADWQLLMLDAASKNAAHDPVAGDQFAAASRLLMAVSLKQADEARALYFRELSARAQLLRALSDGRARDPAFAQQCHREAEALGLTTPTWSLQLLEVLAGRLGASRLHGAVEGDLLRAAELGTIEAILSDGPVSDPPSFPADVSAVDANVFRQALAPSAASKNSQ